MFRIAQLKDSPNSCVKLQLQKMQDEMMDLVDYSSEIQETLGRSYGVPDDLDEEELMGGMISAVILFNSFDLHCNRNLLWRLYYGTELDALEADMGLEAEPDGMPSYLQDDKDSELESDINLPAAPSAMQLSHR